MRALGETEGLKCLALCQGWRFLVEAGEQQVADQVEQAGRRMYGDGAWNEATVLNRPAVVSVPEETSAQEEQGEDGATQ